MEKSLEQFKHIQRISRQTRHYRTHLNQIYHQKLDEELINLTNRYEQTFLRLKTQRKLEQQRKQVLDITLPQIARQRVSLSKKVNKNPLLPSIKQPPTRTSCYLFSQNCQLYPCQPIYHYTSFIKREHDQTLRQRNPSTINSNSSPLKNIFSHTQEKTRRQLSSAGHTHYHLAQRHAHIEDTKARLDEQSRLLHEQLADRKKGDYTKHHQHELQQALQQHLRLSAKFCA